MEEHVLIRHLKDKDKQEAAFRILVEHYQKRLYYHIRSMVLNHQDTDDILQNTFLKIYQNIHRFQEQSSLFTWMYRIATNEALNHLNTQAKQKKVTTEEYHIEQIENLEADPLFDGDQAQILLLKAIAKLPDRQQQIFRMRYFEEMDYKSMSTILNVSVGSLKASYHIANKKIEAFIKSN